MAMIEIDSHSYNIELYFIVMIPNYDNVFFFFQKVCIRITLFLIMVKSLMHLLRSLSKLTYAGGSHEDTPVCLL